MTMLLVTTAHPSLSQHTLDGELHPNLGRLIQPRHTSSIEATAAAGIPWAADNDCFQSLDEAAYVRMLDRIEGLAGCRFVTVPDVVGDAEATLELFDRWAPELERRGLPLALVAQDGLEHRLDRVEWHRLSALFIGGSTEWKEGPAAAMLAQTAKRHGLWVHWGRVNTRRRFDLIAATGAVDSFDGSKFARFRKTYLDGGLEWCRRYDDDVARAEAEAELELEVVLPNGDSATAYDDVDALLQAARTLRRDAADNGCSSAWLRRELFVTVDGRYDAELTARARS